MKKTYKVKIKLKSLLATVFALFLTLTPLSASAVSQHYFIRPLRTGDTVYFDNWDANWDKVRIYMYNSKTDSSQILWKDRPFMTYDSGSIYKYDIAADMKIEQYGYDYIVFTDDTNQQTINLGFVGNGYAYKVDAWQDDKRSGYWYLYNRSAVELQTIRALKTGDVIYFDNSGTNWENVYVYLYSTEGGTERFPWDEKPGMELDPDADSGNIYQYPIDPDLNIEDYKDNHVIFSNGLNEQTINLGFIDTGYAYKVDSRTDQGAIGYWYVYDKTSLKELVARAEAYLARLECLPESDKASLKWAIEYAKLAINNEVPVETEVVGNTEEYWNQIDTEERHLSGVLQSAIDAYGDPTTCEQEEPDPVPDEPDKPDEPGNNPSDESDAGADGDIAVPDTGMNRSSDDQSTSNSTSALSIVVVAFIIAIISVNLIRYRRK